jgi:hypothetical protein
LSNADKKLRILTFCDQQKERKSVGFALLQRAQKLRKAHLPAEQASYAAVGAS